MPAVEIKRGPERFTLRADQTSSLLDQALASGVAIDHSCKRGDCEQCVATLLTGEIGALETGRPCVSGEGVLLCNAVAQTDVVLQLPWSPETRHLIHVRSPCKINALRRLAADVVEIELRLPASARFEFLAGQFIKLTNRHGVTRSYSLANAPGADRLLLIQVRRVESGAFSNYLFDSASAGDLLQLQGPYGRFFLRQGTQVAKTLFLATGTGIAPIAAILQGLGEAERQALGTISLYWGNRHPTDFYLAAALDALRQRVGFMYFQLISRPTTASDSPRHVQELAAAHHPDLAEAQVFACGNPGMIDAARLLCRRSGLRIERFHFDAFTAS